MIVRISTEGQYRLSGADIDRLNEIDNDIVRAVQTGDSHTFDRKLSELLHHVRERGQEVPIDEIVESDIILPAPGITIDEATSIFSGEGLVPG